MMEFIQMILSYIANISILIVEFIGLAVILTSVVRAVLSYLKNSPFTRLNLAEGMATALGFILSGEIIRTIIVHTISEIIIVASIIVIHLALTFLIHREIKSESEYASLLRAEKNAEKGEPSDQ